MKQTINESEFRNAFYRMGKGHGGLGEQFSYDGLTALYNYLEQLGDDTGEEIELDVIAIYCEYAEYECLQEFQEAYGKDYKSLEDIENQTTLIPLDDKKDSLTGFIIRQF